MVLTQFKSTTRTLAAIVVTTLISACADTENMTTNETVLSGTGAITQQETPSASLVVSGSIGDGPVVGASISLTDNKGQLIATTTSDSNTNYTVTIPVDSEFPITISATGGLDIVTNMPLDFQMYSIVEDKNNETANINPYSTLIVKTAMNMNGGLTPSNIRTAKQKVTQRLNFGLDLTLVPDPISTQITEDNVANIVKSSEVFAEMIRRTSNALLIVGVASNEDKVIEALSADMTDGLIDGVGTEKVNPLFSATAVIVSGQVIIEALSNNLYVNNALATSLLDNAILVSMPTATDTTADVLTNAEIIIQARRSVSAARMTSSSSSLPAIAKVLETLSPGTPANDIYALLPVVQSNDFSDAINNIVFIPESQLNNIMLASRNAEAPGSFSEGNDYHDNTSQSVDKLVIENVSSSAYDASRNRVPENAIDGDTSTKWTTLEMPQWISFDLGQTKLVSKVRMLFYGANEGADFDYEISTSNDNINWSTVISEATFALSPEWTEISFNPTSAKYVRVSLNSKNPSDYANLYEIELYGITTSTTDNNMPQKRTLSWDANPGQVLGYVVYSASRKNATFTEFRTIDLESNNIDPDAPMIQYDPITDLNYQDGDSICFKVRAYNSDGLSGLSQAVCGSV